MKIEYDKANRVIYLTDKVGMREVLENDYPSEPVISPKGEKAAYISPLEWECIGNLYMLDLVSGEKEILLVPKSNRRVPKGVIWIDTENLAVILGFGMGTVETGGNVFFYNIKTDKLTQITQYDPYIQILSMHLEGELLRLEGIEYTDDNYLESKKFEEAIPI